MNAHLRTLPLSRAVQPIREHGASALDGSATAWLAPLASDRVLDRWGMPVRVESFVAWPAPDPVMRFDLPAPDSMTATVSTVEALRWSDLVDPTHPVAVPDLRAAARVATTPQPEVAADPWPAPILGTAVATHDSQVERLSTRAIIGLAAVAGTIIAGTAALIAIF